MAVLRTTLLVFACVYTVITAEHYPLTDASIDRINSKQTSWKAGRNFHPNTTLIHLRKLVGTHPKSSINTLPGVEYDVNLMDVLPENFDPRDKWPICPTLNEIRDQGSCGSCWAFSAVGVMTDRVCIQSNGTQHFHFSAEDLISCCGNRCGDCQGGGIEQPWFYWQKHGLVSGGNYGSKQGCKPYSFPNCEQRPPTGSIEQFAGNKEPCYDYYDAKTPKCLKKCEDGYNVAYKKDKRYGKLIYKLSDQELLIKAELFLHGPVAGSFRVYSDFFNYKSGVYKYVEGHFVYGHSVKILGWGVENGIKYWLVANSWNTEWGDDGFFKILRGVNHLGIESSIITGAPLLTDNY